MQPYTFLMLFTKYFLNLQPSTDEVTTTKPASTSEPESPCSDEDNGSQVQPEDSNLTSLAEVKPGSSQQQCNTFKVLNDATAGESISTQFLLTNSFSL